MAELIRGLDPEVVRTNLAFSREKVAAAARVAGRDPKEVQILAAVKYVPIEELDALAEAGVELLGENRVQDLSAKRAASGDRFTWDFIGHLQSRKVKQVLPLVRLIHSVATESVLEQLNRHGDGSTRVMVEVNVSGEPSKDGVEPGELGPFLERCPVQVVGLMTMPPETGDPEASRTYFAALRELAERHRLPELSMGTSQDYEVAVQEGATIVRLGRSLYTGQAAAS